MGDAGGLRAFLEAPVKGVNDRARNETAIAGHQGSAGAEHLVPIIAFTKGGSKDQRQRAARPFFLHLDDEGSTADADANGVTD